MLTDTRVTGQLRVVVLKARHLQNRRKLEKQNPYVTLRIGHIVETTTVDYRGGQTPHWDVEAKFELTPEIEPVMKLSILDETKKTPTLIAEKTIDITPAFSRSPKVGYDKWYQVEYGGREAGEIFLEMTFYPTAPKVPLKIPIKNRAGMTKSSSARPLPTLPGQESHAQLMRGPLSDDILVKSFSSSAIGRKLPSPPMPETIPLTGDDQIELVHNAFAKSAAHSIKPEPQRKKSHMDINDLLFDNGEDRRRPKSTDFSTIKKFATKFQAHEQQQQQQQQEDSNVINNIFRKRPLSTSPKKSFFSRFTNNQQQNQSSEDAFDLLEQEVQSDWEKNHPNEFQDALNRRFGNQDEEKDVTSSWTRSISSLKQNKSDLPLYAVDDEDSFDEEDEDELVPLPPPKSNNSSRSGNSLFSTHRSNDSNDYARIAEQHHDLFIRNSPKQRKPPPSLSSSTNSSDILGPRFSELAIDIPYSADSIGSKPDRSVFLKSQKLPKLPNGRKEDEVMQEKYYAPQPDKHLAKQWRLESGHIKDGDLDPESGLSGYKGAGEWSEEFASSFSPTRFRAKPLVPPKVPIGLTNEEYYVTDRRGFLTDIRGRRE